MVSSSLRRWASVQFAAIVIRQFGVTQNMFLRGFQQDQRRLIKVILRLLLTMLLHLRHQLTQPVIPAGAGNQ